MPSSRFRNAQNQSPVIPKRVLDKAPSAELRPEQKDEDSLPPYHILDPILQAYVEEDRSLEEIVALGFSVKAVRKGYRSSGSKRIQTKARTNWDKDYPSERLAKIVECLLQTAIKTDEYVSWKIGTRA